MQVQDPAGHGKAAGACGGCLSGGLRLRSGNAGAAAGCATRGCAACLAQALSPRFLDFKTLCVCPSGVSAPSLLQAGLLPAFLPALGGQLKELFNLTSFALSLLLVRCHAASADTFDVCA